MQQKIQGTNIREQVLFKNTCFISMSICLIGFVFNMLVLDNSPIATIAFVVGIAFGVLYILNRNKTQLHRAGFYYIIIAVLGLNACWFSSGGITGSTPLVFLVFAVLMASFVPSSKYHLILGAILLNMAVLIAIQYHTPEWIAQYSSEQLRQQDIIISIFVTLTLSSYTVYTFKQAYLDKQTLLEHQNNQLQASEKALQSAKDKAESANEVKSTFLSVMSHEIRTPLNAIVGISNLLNQYDYDNTEKVELVEALHFSSQHLLDLLNDILDFNKLESGQIKLNPQPLHLNTFLKQLKQSYQTKAAEQNNQLVLDLATVPSQIVIDSKRLRQILGNLVSNAIKFTTNGIINLSVQNSGITEDNITLLFCVNDTGIGIEIDQQEDIFKQFTQTTPTESGTGLGLAITARLLTLMGSKIQVESTPNVGSKFYFSLTCPIIRKKKKHTDTPTLPLNTAPQLLLVEDNPTNVLVLSHFLKKWDIPFKVAENGLEAVEFYQHQPFQLILMDMQMPKMNGFEATQKIRESDKQIPIIALTASATTHEKERAQRAGVNEYLTKPFDPKQLYQVIQKHLKKQLVTAV